VTNLLAQSSSLAESSAANVASAVAESVQYHGRKAIRRGSEQRRQAILDAAMRIIVREGVRAVRHRAVAAEAGVPLSATTYYFKDINDLITDTFAQYVERSAAQLGEFWERTHAVLPSPDERGSLASRRLLVDQMAKLAVDYVLTQLLTRRDELVADQAFRQEALRNPHLSEMVRAHRQILDRGISHLVELLGSPLPHQDARLLTALIAQMEYQGLLDGVERLDCDEMQAVFKRHMHLILELNLAESPESAAGMLTPV
jgi:DNA-binding transcriptional regulator YbjK